MNRALKARLGSLRSSMKDSVPASLAAPEERDRLAAVNGGPECQR
jgi:hypothetical protein